MSNNLIARHQLQIRLSRIHTITRLRKYNVSINGQRSYIREGSLKPQGWQITIGDDFRESTLQGRGFLVFPRGPGVLIPLRDLRQMIGHELGQHHRVDIFISFGPGVQMHCKGSVYDLSRFVIP